MKTEREGFRIYYWYGRLMLDKGLNNAQIGALYSAMFYYSLEHKWPDEADWTEAMHDCFATIAKDMDKHPKIKVVE